jgi:hypothetical protein
MPAIRDSGRGLLLAGVFGIGGIKASPIIAAVPHPWKCHDQIS